MNFRNSFLILSIYTVIVFMIIGINRETKNLVLYQFGLCSLNNSLLVGRVIPSEKVLPFASLNSLLKGVQHGGIYRPQSCFSKEKTAIIVPFRNREQHLQIFLNNIHPFLQRQRASYRIFVIDQVDNGRFNRATLLNIGYTESKLYDNFTCFIFHDVDLLPEDDRNGYNCTDQPRHMSIAINKNNYKLTYESAFGGVVAITKEQFEKVNGYSNRFFGWGCEDDDMWRRMVDYTGYKVVRYPQTIGRYTMIKHGREKNNMPSNKCKDSREKLLDGGKMFHKIDGLNTLRYIHLRTDIYQLFTKISVSLNESEIQEIYKL